MLYKDIAEFFNNLTGSNGNTKDITARSDDPVVEITPVDVSCRCNSSLVMDRKMEKRTMVAISD